MVTLQEFPGDSALDVMRRLAQGTADRPFLHGLIKEDIERWNTLSPAARQIALMRARRRANVAKRLGAQPNLFAA